MTVLEAFRSKSKEELARILCDIVQDAADLSDDYFCDRCPASKWCRNGHNGFIDWLEKAETR